MTELDAYRKYGTVQVKESFDLKYKEIIETKKSLVD